MRLRIEGLWGRFEVRHLECTTSGVRRRATDCKLSPARMSKGVKAIEQPSGTVKAACPKVIRSWNLPCRLLLRAGALRALGRSGSSIKEAFFSLRHVPDTSPHVVLACCLLVLLNAETLSTVLFDPIQHQNISTGRAEAVKQRAVSRKRIRAGSRHNHQRSRSELKARRRVWK